MNRPKNKISLEGYDYTIIGAGFFGLYAAKYLSKKGLKVLIIEKDKESFQRASYINQARIHNGYHYPRSLATAKKTAEYYERFMKEFSFCINHQFNKIYGIAESFTLTNPKQFENFCKACGIPYQERNPKDYFNPRRVQACYLVEEASFDAGILKAKMIEELQKQKVKIYYQEEPTQVSREDGFYFIQTNQGKKFYTPHVLNATYSGINGINQLFGFPKEPLKYELCEVTLVEPSTNLKNIGLTVMDGPFLSIMPFGKTKYHSLTAVSYTPIREDSSHLPTFPCQNRETRCKPESLLNCNLCKEKPKTFYPYMDLLAKKYLSPEFHYRYQKSLFAIKTLLTASEMDDSRPTIIKKYSHKPTYRMVFSGKINTVFDLEEELEIDTKT